MTPTFCSLLATGVEDLYATTPHMERFVLIEYNHAWEEKAFENSKLISESTKQYLNKCIENRIFSRLFLIKNKSSAQAVIRIFLVDNRQQAPYYKQIKIAHYEQLQNLDFKVLFEDPAGKKQDPFYLVCTHGKVDMCCSKFGLPILKKLEEFSADVWQVTHVTGDRFAPNVVQVPYGHYYGHLKMEEMEQFYAALINNKIYSPKYRGRSCHSKPAQAAEHFLRNHTGDYHPDMLILEESFPTVSDTHTFGFLDKRSGDTYHVSIRAALSQQTYFMNCKAEEKKPVDVFTLVKLCQLHQAH